MVEFAIQPDTRTPQCDHDELTGCYRCCQACNFNLHRCGQCGEPMVHYSCSGSELGWCSPCRKDYYNHVE